MIKGVWMSLCEIQSEDTKRALEFADAARLAAEATHCAFAAQSEVEEIKWAVATGERDRMWSMLQTKIAKLRGFIVGTSPITKITVVDLADDAASKLSDEQIRIQLKILIGYVYAYYAMRGAFRIAFQECFSKMTRKLSFVG